MVVRLLEGVVGRAVALHAGTYHAPFGEQGGVFPTARTGKGQATAEVSLGRGVRLLVTRYLGAEKMQEGWLGGGPVEVIGGLVV